MYAIIETGGKQYKVAEGDELKLESLVAGEGEKVVFDRVFLVNDGKEVKIGQPHISGAQVTARVAEHGKNKKITVIKFKSKSRYRRKYGHRQPYSKVLIESIKV
ncbi:MAG: 50S ribosomal protein L21 [Patescibacteria group bacterium]